LRIRDMRVSMGMAETNSKVGIGATAAFDVATMSLKRLFVHNNNNYKINNM